MASDPSDREDLLREATALAERIEFAPMGAADAERVVVGFRGEAAASFYFGSDPVYQFNTKGQLRRAFCDDALFKAVRGRLVSLKRVRSAQEVQLLRRDLSSAEQTAFLVRMTSLLQELRAGLDRGNYRTVGQVPEGSNVLSRVQTWLAAQREPSVAATPHVQAPGGEHCG